MVTCKATFEVFRCANTAPRGSGEQQPGPQCPLPSPQGLQGQCQSSAREQRHFPGLQGCGQMQRWHHGRRGLTPQACWFTANEANPAALEHPPLPANLGKYFNMPTGAVCGSPTGTEYLHMCKLLHFWNASTFGEGWQAATRHSVQLRIQTCWSNSVWTTPELFGIELPRLEMTDACRSTNKWPQHNSSEEPASAFLSSLP